MMPPSGGERQLRKIKQELIAVVEGARLQNPLYSPLDSSSCKMMSDLHLLLRA